MRLFFSVFFALYIFKVLVFFFEGMENRKKIKMFPVGIMKKSFSNVFVLKMMSCLLENSKLKRNYSTRTSWELDTIREKCVSSFPN